MFPPSLPGTRRHVPVIEDIAPRLLFSADAASQVLEASLIDPLQQAGINQPAVPVAATQQQVQARELAVIDSRLTDVDQLIADLQQQQDGGRALEWILVDAQTDGLTRLGEQLSQAQAAPYTAVHLLTHGDADGFELGAQRIDAGTLRLQAAQIAQWSGGLAEDADLLIYGCDLASSAQGRELLTNLAMLTGADVAASDDITGAGGDWTLEYQQGSREADIAVSGVLAATWQGQLAIGPAGAETLVNNAAGNQSPDAMAYRQVASNGLQTVVVWEKGDDVYFRIYGANATSGEVKLVNNNRPFSSEVIGRRDQPSVAMAANGDFVIVWSGSNNIYTDKNIYGQRFNADGSAKARPSGFGGAPVFFAANGNEFQINRDTGTWSEDQYDPAVAMRADGSFMVTWTDETTGSGGYTLIRHVLIGSDGNPVNAPEGFVDSEPSGVKQTRSAVAAQAGTGEWVVSFLRDEGNSETVVVVPMTGTGTPDPATPSSVRILQPDQTQKSDFQDVAYKSDGEVVWASVERDGSNRWIELYARDLADTVTPLTPAIVNDLQLISPGKVSLSLTENDSILVTWEQQSDADGTRIIRTRQYDAGLNPLGPSQLVPVTTAGNQTHPSATSANGQAVFTWLGNGTQPGQSDTNGVFIRAFAISAPGFSTGLPAGNQTTENGAVTQSFAVVLNSAPSATVTVTVNTSDAAESGFSPATLTFSPGNWSVPQTVTVFGRDDAVIDGNQPFTITLAASSPDPAWNNLPVQSVDFVNIDDDTFVNVPIGPINDVDGAPDQLSESAAPGAVAGITARAIDPDGGDAVTYAILDANSTLAVHPSTGVITRSGVGILNYETQTSVSATVRATSTDGSFSDEVFTVTVLDENDTRPSIPPQAFNVPENAVNGTLVGQVIANDPDTVGSLSGWTLVGGSSIFAIDGSGRITVIDQAQLDHEATPFVDLQVQVQDGVQTSLPGTVRIDIDDVNEAPAGTGNTVWTPEDTDLVLRAADFPFSDPEDGSTLSSLTIDTLPTRGQLIYKGSPASTTQLVTAAELAAGELVYRPPADAHGAAYDTIQVTVRDAANQPAATASTLTIDVVPVNDPPVMNTGGSGAPVTVATPENRLDPVSVSALDADADPLQFAIVGGPDQARFAIAPGSQLLRLVQPPDFESPTDSDRDNRYEVHVAASDGTAQGTTQVFVFQVTDEIEPLAINGPGALVTAEDTPLALQGGARLTVLDQQAGTNLVLTVQVSAGRLGLDPLASAGRTLTLQGSATTISQALAGLTYLPDADFNGADMLHADLADGANPSRTTAGKFGITITAVNDAPTLSGSRWVNAAPGATTLIDTSMLNAQDVDDAAIDLVYTLGATPGQGDLLLRGQRLVAGGEFTQADIEAGALAWRAPQRDSADEVLQLIVRDASGAQIGGVEMRILGTSVFTPPADDDLPDAGAGRDRDESAGDSLDAGTTTGLSVNPGDAHASVPADQVMAPAPLAARAPGGFAPPPEAERAAANGRSTGRLNLEREAGSGQAFAPISSRLSALPVSVAPDRTDGQPRDIYERARLDGYSLANLERASSQLREFSRSGEKFDRQVVASTVAVSTGVSIGYVIWLVRGGALLSSLLASLPAWRSIDPLPVLNSLNDQARNDADEESLESMLKQARQQPGVPVPGPVAATDGHTAGETERTS
ncbi:MAG: DUF4347 domain-containing protein [Burkholderiaceae bacterium]